MLQPDIQSLPCYLHGEYATLGTAKISVLDRGFIFGDGIYEVIPVYGGRPFRLDHHLARLERSLAEVRMVNPLARRAWIGIVAELVQRLSRQSGRPVAEQDHLIYIQITRGVAPRDHVMPQGLQPTVFVMITPMKQPSESQRRDGVSCLSLDDFRWRKGHIKSTSLLAAVLARQHSADADAVETILLRDGFLTEASASNVWVVRHGQVLGAPRDNLVLEGIRYGLIESLCQQLNIPFALRRISRDEVFEADEVLLSSATKEILSVVRIDDHRIGAGRPGPLGQRLHAAYRAAVTTQPDLHTLLAQGDAA